MACKPQHKYDNFSNFLFQCSKFVNAIENYTGNDRLIPWYEYILWLEENFDIDCRKETIFEHILARCLREFEFEERYKQDRRLIKLFIRYINYQDDQDQYYKMMVSKGYGTRVADLYINWAFYFDKHGNFSKADDIFRQGFESYAMPIDQLRYVHEQFGFSMSRRMLYPPNHHHRHEDESRMNKLREEMSVLRISGTISNHSKSSAFHLFDRSTLLTKCVPNATYQSLSQNVHDTSIVLQMKHSLEKKRHVQKQPPKLCASRFDFLAKTSSESTSRLVKPFNYDLQPTTSFLKPSRLPAKTPISTASNYLESSSSSGYESLTLNNDITCSPKAICSDKWITHRKNSKKYVKPCDTDNKISTKNLPQSEWNVPRIGRFSFEDDQHKFMIPMVNIYPKHSGDEFSLEEIMWQKRKTKSLQGKNPIKANVNTNQTKSTLATIVPLQMNKLLAAKSKKQLLDRPKAPIAGIWRQNSREAIIVNATRVVKPKELRFSIADNKENECNQWKQSTPKKYKAQNIANFISNRPKATDTKRPNAPTGFSLIRQNSTEVMTLNANKANNYKPKGTRFNIFEDKEPQILYKKQQKTLIPRKQRNAEPQIIEETHIENNNVKKRPKAPGFSIWKQISRDAIVLNTSRVTNVKPKELRFTMFGNDENIFNSAHPFKPDEQTGELEDIACGMTKKTTISNEPSKLILSQPLLDVFKGSNILITANKQLMELYDESTTIEPIMSKQPTTCSTQAKKSAHKYTFSYELQETTEEFERLEAMCTADLNIRIKTEK
ncbi:uncharacterized protein LOC116344214 [Contarinia nasturtii]|uniref:uncharacterized protein LOC116344214 n=1 Tax=Contarinia nasturtii TaxID=265458 RepID=UPI0012D3B583|nr:uncharacterized protein LOC116344214 [Contarinia nasturtii]